MSTKNTSGALNDKVASVAEGDSLLEEDRTKFSKFREYMIKTVTTNVWKKLIVISVLLSAFNVLTTWPSTFRFPSVDVVNYLNIIMLPDFKRSFSLIDEIMKGIYLRNEETYLLNMNSLTIAIDPSLAWNKGAIVLEISECYRDFLLLKRKPQIINLSTKLSQNLLSNWKGFASYGQSSTDLQAREFINQTLLGLYQSLQLHQVTSLATDLVKLKSYNRISMWGTVTSSVIMVAVILVDIFLKTAREYQIGLWSLCMLCLSSQISFVITQLVCLSIITHKFATDSFGFSLLRCCLLLVYLMVVLWYVFRKCSELAYKCDIKAKLGRPGSQASSVYSEDLRLSHATGTSPLSESAMNESPLKIESTQILVLLPLLSSSTQASKMGSLDPFRKTGQTIERVVKPPQKNRYPTPLSSARNMTAPILNANRLSAISPSSEIQHPKLAETQRPS